MSSSKLEQFAEECTRPFSRLDVVVNNAAAFFPTPLASLNPGEFDTLIDINLKAPLFLAQHFAPALRKQRGCIVNLIDIHGEKPLKEYLAYSVSKAGLIMLTKALAAEMAPHVRVNGISPGAILWPEDTDELNELQKLALLDRIPAGILGTPAAIAKGVLYLVRDAAFVTGQVISIDGGQSIA
jgi:pteridine reductase